jgi:hypothetical protein
MPKAVLILGEEDGGFRCHPSLCEDSPPEWFICLTEDQNDELRSVLREWKQRGVPVVLRLTWAPGDFNIRCTVLPARTGKPYRLLHPTPGADFAVAQPAFELPFDLKEYLGWLMSENWPEEEDAICEEVIQRFKRGELAPEGFKQFVQVVKELHQESSEQIKFLQKTLRRSNFRWCQNNPRRPMPVKPVGDVIDDRKFEWPESNSSESRRRINN